MYMYVWFFKKNTFSSLNKFYSLVYRNDQESDGAIKYMGKAITGGDFIWDASPKCFYSKFLASIVT